MMKYTWVGMVCLLVVIQGCSESSKKDVIEDVKTKEATLDVVSKNLKKSTNSVIDEATKMAKELKVGTQDLAKDLQMDATLVVRKVGETSKKVITQAATSTQALKDVAIEKIDDATKVVEENIQAAIPASDEKPLNVLRGEELYLKCSGCHGLKGEKKALNNSEIIQGWDVERTVQSLKGYTSGTYGKAMKAVMQSQVKGLSDEDIDSLAHYIYQLK